MIKTIMIIIAMAIIAISVAVIYDARSIAQKFFSADQTNKNVKVLKIVGVVVLWITLGIIYRVH